MITHCFIYTQVKEQGLMQSCGTRVAIALRNMKKLLPAQPSGRLEKNSSSGSSKSSPVANRGAYDYQRHNARSKALCISLLSN